MTNEKPIPSENKKKDQNKKQLQVSFRWFTKSLKSLLTEFFNVDKNADIDGTVANIKRDSQFGGHSVWILIFSIFIASIGLNLNSTAVIIGAMLISPLMGPIQGIGLSIATNDFETLISSFRNLLIMVVVALLTSSLFFTISPFQEAQSELLSRTKPNLFDAFVAIFGGLSGIIAGSRYDRGNVIPGVAIATALMPPLCTAGYGLATLQMDFFFGALYLFLLNSAFICISTIVVSKYLKIPLVKYVDPIIEKRIRKFIVVIAFVVIIPSLMTLFYVSIEESNTRKIKDFVRTEMKYKKTLVFESNYHFNTDTVSTAKAIFNTWFKNSEGVKSNLQLMLTGETVDSIEEVRLFEVIQKYVPNTTLELMQAKDNKRMYTHAIGQLEDKSELLEQAFKQSQSKLQEQTKIIEAQNLELETFRSKDLMVESMASDIKSFYPNIEEVQAAYLKNGKGKEIPTLLIKWNGNTTSNEQNEQLENLRQWFIKKTASKEVQVFSI